MEILSIFLVFSATLPSALVVTTERNGSNKFKECPDYGPIEHGVVRVLQNYVSEDSPQQTIRIVCENGYDLEGSPKLWCVDGEWEKHPRPHCVARCFEPPSIKYGSLEIEGDKINGKYRKGTLATYSCKEGFTLSPPESRYRVCEKGIWTGAPATCIPVGCPQPKVVENGYYVHEKNDYDNLYGLGQRLHYSCSTGYTLVGNSVQQCLEDGTWSPKLQPLCLPLAGAESSDEDSCQPAPSIPHAMTTVVRGFQNDETAVAGTEVEVRCVPRYRNNKGPCLEPTKIRCVNGRWVGTLPTCVPARDCLPPPLVPHSRFWYIGDLEKISRYPINSRIVYRCWPGYQLEGNDAATCTSDGCWSPSTPPVCKKNMKYFFEVNSAGPILISVATGAGVLLLLIVICLAIICRRRKPLSRAVALPPPVPRAAEMADHATLLNHPDRLALIAFADGVQNGQPTLPTYEEAIRDHRPSLTSNRLHRPHWPFLAQRRARNSPEGSHATRQGSLFRVLLPSSRRRGCCRRSVSRVSRAQVRPPPAPIIIIIPDVSVALGDRYLRVEAHPSAIRCDALSRPGHAMPFPLLGRSVSPPPIASQITVGASHSASTRSGGDPMGSTDTMIVSEGSTAVTLDTVSSHSGSQSASCRAHCGSLASFDTGSVHNTEGVPLLEENELEDTNVDSHSLAIENRSMADNNSAKLSITSPEVP